MVTYSLDSNEIFLSHFNADTVRVFHMSALNSAVVKASDFEFIHNVGISQKYDGLEMFGVVIGGSALKKLAETLCNSRFVVNREGFCYVNTKGVVEQSFGVEYYRLNDLFNWFDYGVKASITTIWIRCDICKGGTLVNYVEQNKSFQECQNDLIKKEMEIMELKHQLAELRDAEKQLPGNKEELKKVNPSELDGLMSKVAALESELKQFSAETEVKSSKSDLDLSKAKAETLQAELNQCRVEAELKSTKREVSVDALRSSKTELESLKAEVAALQKEMKSELSRVKDYDKVRYELFDVKAKLKFTKTELELSKLEVATSQSEVKYCEKQLLVKEEEFKKMRFELSAVKAELRFTKCEIEMLKVEVSALQAEIKDYEKHLTAKEEEFKKVRLELSDVKAELKFTRSGFDV